MPTLYSGLHLLSHDKPSYVSYERASTFDAAEFPDRAFVYPVADPTGHERSDETPHPGDQRRGPHSGSAMGRPDLRCRLHDWFVAQGIDSARVKVTMLSDGTATYNNFHNSLTAMPPRPSRTGTTTPPKSKPSTGTTAAVIPRPARRRSSPPHLALLPLDAPRLPADAAKQQPDGVLLPVHRRPAGCNEDGERPALRTADSPSRGFETTVLPHGHLTTLLRGAVRPVAEEKPHHHRHEPQFRRERTAAGGLCGTDHTAVRQRLRHLLLAPSRRQLVGRLPRPVRGADAAAGPDAVRNLRLGAARQNRHDRRLPLDDLYLRTARQGGLPLPPMPTDSSGR